MFSDTYIRLLQYVFMFCFLYHIRVVRLVILLEDGGSPQLMRVVGRYTEMCLVLPENEQ